ASDWPGSFPPDRRRASSRPFRISRADDSPFLWRERMTSHPREPQTPMDAFEAARTLLPVRRYPDKPVPGPAIRSIVDAGRRTGSGMNGQPWPFIVVRAGDTLHRLGSLASSGSYVAEAPLAIVVAIDKTRFAVSDASRAIQSMLLTAWADGVGS